MIFNKIWPCDIIEETTINDWKQFSYEYGINNGLNEMEAVSFSDMISYFIADGPAVPLDSKYFKIQKILFDILAVIPDIKEIKDEKDQVNTLFDYIFIMYNEKIYEYAKRSERLSFRVTQKQMADFKSVPGKTLTDKLQTLLVNYYKN
ncbi:MAG: hypothetical protein J6T69_01475 [Methanobrevibacter sp.]|nr:hypothetical protein [Methanobrevibacter sp.]